MLGIFWRWIKEENSHIFDFRNDVFHTENYLFRRQRYFRPPCFCDEFFLFCRIDWVMSEQNGRFPQLTKKIKRPILESVLARRPVAAGAGAYSHFFTKQTRWGFFKITKFDFEISKKSHLKFSIFF
jgi:hypothetical protein